MATPDYTFWDGQEEFSQLVAAALCCDIEPEYWTRENPVPPKLREMEKRILQEVKYRDTSRTERVWNQNWREWRTHHIQGERFFGRTKLKTWAETKGLRPPFLFPEDRNESKEDRIRADTKESLLVMIALLSRALVEKAGPGAGTPEDPTQAFLVRRIQEEAKACKFQGSGLSPSNLNLRLKEAFDLLRDLSKVRT
jgi:hypothetical protein